MIRNVIFLIIFLYSYFQISVCDTTKKPGTTVATTPSGDGDGNTTEEYDAKYPYCFHFTWLGPTYDNTSRVNGSCKGLKDKFHMKNIPCMEPLVITFDGSPPDTEYLWQHYRKRVLCKKSRGEVCISYSYRFNYQLLNVTYMCGKAFAIDEGTVTSGCYNQAINGYDVEACVCQSHPGMKPCNVASGRTMSVLTLIFIMLISQHLRYLFV